MYINKTKRKTIAKTVYPLSKAAKKHVRMLKFDDLNLSICFLSRDKSRKSRR